MGQDVMEELAASLDPAHVPLVSQGKHRKSPTCSGLWVVEVLRHAVGVMRAVPVLPRAREGVPLHRVASAFTRHQLPV